MYPQSAQPCAASTPSFILSFPGFQHAPPSLTQSFVIRQNLSALESVCPFRNKVMRLEKRAARLPVPLPLAQGADPIYAHVARLLVNAAVAPLPGGRVPIPSNHRAVARLARPV